MSLLDDAADEIADRQPDETDVSAGSLAATASIESRAGEVEVAGETVQVEPPQTVKTSEEGGWFAGDQLYGRPRGRDAIQARQVVQSAAMQAIVNGITDQLLGGELAAESDDDVLDSSEAEIWALLREILTGPHLGGLDLDDLITAAVEDMLGPGNAYWQLHAPETGDLPVVALSNLDALTIRHNITKHGLWKDPPLYQAPSSAFGGNVAPLGGIDPIPMSLEDVAIMHYPRGARSYKWYPASPALQVMDWLEVLTNSTTHHNRFYSDNQIPPGVISVLDSQAGGVDKIKDQLEAASGDPRDVPIVEGSAQWMELGGTAVNLNLIEEQRWFFQLCLASLGLGKQELGFIEDVNRSNGEVEASRIYKRITGPFTKQFEGAFTHIADRFDVYNALDDPFDITLRHTDPRAEIEQEERLRKLYDSGALTLREFKRRQGNEDLADNEMTVDINGQEIEYGDFPKHIVDALLRDARDDPDANADLTEDDDAETT